MDMLTYFGEEKIQNLICIIIGSLSVIISLVFLFIIKYSFYRGMAVPLLAFGVLQIVAGSIAFKRASTDMIGIEQIREQNPEKIATEELARMQVVLKDFGNYQWIEMVLLLAGFFLYMGFRKSTLTFWKGLGLGLLLQAGITLTLDTVAKNRTQPYTDYLRTL
jgi:hypothetical protein